MKLLEGSRILTPGQRPPSAWMRLHRQLYGLLFVGHHHPRCLEMETRNKANCRACVGSMSAAAPRRVRQRAERVSRRDPTEGTIKSRKEMKDVHLSDLDLLK